MKKGGLLLDQVKSKISKVDVVSFDIFDTLLVRPYIRPVDVFLHMEKALERPGFYEERRDAERRVRVRHPELEDITFDMIYEEIDDEFKDMKQKEMDWEEMVLRANPELKQVYDYVKEQGKKIIITSDMYLPTEFIAKILRKNGYDGWDKLYVSGDLNKKKRTGSLYYHILEEIKTAPKNILHIGDNVEVDYNVPHNMGLLSAMYKKLTDRFLATHQAPRVFRKQTSDKLSSSILIAMFAYRWQQQCCTLQEEDGYWENLGFRYGGPIVYGYTQFIAQKAKEEKIDKLLFVARDGYNLQKIFDLFYHEISNDYIYAPRFLNTAYYFDFAKNGRYKEFIPDILKFYTENNKELSEIINIDENENYEHIIEQNKSLLQKYASKYIKQYRENIEKKIKGKKNIAVVDLTTTYFTSHTFIERILGNPISSFYAVIYSLDKKPRNLNYFNWCEKYNIRNNIALFLEFLITSPEPPVENVTKDGQPVYKNKLNDYECIRSNIYKKISQGIREFADDINGLFGNYGMNITEADAFKNLENFIKFPREKDIKQISKIRYSIDAGNRIYKPCLAYIPGLKDYIFHPVKSINIIKTMAWKTSFQKFLLYGIYNKEQRASEKNIKIFGLPFYLKKIEKQKVKTKRWFGLFKTIKRLNKKSYYILGIKIYSKRFYPKICKLDNVDISKIIDTISLHTQRAISVAMLHSKSFAGFKNKYNQQNVVLVGAGPTVKQFEIINDSIYIGLNRAFLFDKVQFDYLFAIDKKAIEQFKKEFWAYKAVKFVGDQNIDKNFQISESEIANQQHVRRYKTTARYLPGKFALDLETEALANSTSVSLQAMQFILFTQPKRVYLVGIDCSIAKQEHFIGGGYDISQRGENPKLNDMIHINDWKRMKDFRDTYYPETEIISVNPIGLKGIFHDVYTRSYLAKHPEIDAETVEILEEK